MHIATNLAVARTMTEHATSLVDDGLDVASDALLQAAAVVKGWVDETTEHGTKLMPDHPAVRALDALVAASTSRDPGMLVSEARLASTLLDQMA